MIIPLSTITPIARAIPVSDIMFDVSPNAFSRIKLIAMVIGIWITMLKALLQLRRNNITMRLTIIISSTNFPLYS